MKDQGVYVIKHNDGSIVPWLDRKEMSDAVVL